MREREEHGVAEVGYGPKRDSRVLGSLEIHCVQQWYTTKNKGGMKCLLTVNAD